MSIPAWARSVDLGIIDQRRVQANLFQRFLQLILQRVVVRAAPSMTSPVRCLSLMMYELIFHRRQEETRSWWVRRNRC